MTVLKLLEGIPGNELPISNHDWFADIERSLVQSPNDWVDAAAQTLSNDHAWSLLSWVEVAATQIVRTQSRETLTTAAFAMSVVVHSRLDLRDCSVVASLLRRAADMCGFDYRACIAEGCDRAGPMGQKALSLLLNADARTPPTHTEFGANETFSFARRPPDFDVHDLMRRLGVPEG